MNNIYDAALSLPSQESKKYISSLLKGMSEEEIISLAKELIEKIQSTQRVALFELIVKKVNKHSNLIALIEYSLNRRLINEIGYLLRYVFPKLGEKKLVNFIFNQMDDELIKIAVYQLQFIDSEKLKAEIKKYYKQ